MINFHINSDLSSTVIVFCQFLLHLIKDNILTDGRQVSVIHKSTQTLHCPNCLKLERNFARKTNCIRTALMKCLNLFLCFFFYLQKPTVHQNYQRIIIPAFQLRKTVHCVLLLNELYEYLNPDYFKHYQVSGNDIYFVS